MGLYNSVREWFNSLEDDEQCLEACKESGEKTKRTVGMRLLIDLYGNDDWIDGNELKELVGLNNEELEWLRYLKFRDSIGNILSLDIRNFVARYLQQNDKKAQVQVINEGEESLMPKQGITFWSADEGFLEVTEDDIQRYLEEEHRELKEETENILADITDIDSENAFVEMNARRKYLDAEQLFSESADDFPYKEQLRQKANEALNWLKVLAIEDPSEQVNSEMRENLKLFEMVGQFKIRLIKYSRIRLKKDSEGNILRDSKGDVLKEYVSCDWDKSMKVLTGIYGKKRVNKLKEFLNGVN